MHNLYVCDGLCSLGQSTMRIDGKMSRAAHPTTHVNFMQVYMDRMKRQCASTHGLCVTPICDAACVLDGRLAFGLAMGNV